MEKNIGNRGGVHEISDYSGMLTPLQRIRLLKSYSFIRSATVAISGAATAQLITVAFSPLITRLYGPEAFGVVAVFSAAVMIIASVSDLMYGAAIVLPHSDQEARSLFKLSIITCLIVALISFIGFGIFREQVAHAIGFTASPALLMLGPLLVLLSGFCQPLHHWLYRVQRFDAISRISVVEAIANNTSKVTVGLIVATAPTLLILGVMSQILQTALLWIGAKPTLTCRDTAGKVDGAPNSSITIKEVAYRFRDFPLFRAPQKWLRQLSYNIPSLLLAALLEPAAAGFYLLANRVIRLPNTVIAEAAGPVFLARIAEASHQSESLRPILVKGTAALAILGLIPFGLMAIAGPWLFGHVFGSEWRVAGVYARWLSLSSYFAFLAVPTLAAIPILGLQGQFLIYEIAVTVIGIASLVFGALLLQSEIAAIALFSTMSALAIILQIVWCLICCDSRTRHNE
ncbi:lipopolysaccharide biosynthesis protein [Microvirga sp. VF16]|uniref:lipopolysaccharide biosynthesis protein n=1 Tax=Microvirga sp. VF16 TaxID=2807101 RepID=UPI00193E9C1E|nr:oligosaccharide flippase family protein [Microvirga sp. VF16]QRM27241.1 oligosaccharide flippase family protein [Microvirga sp. VF16]